MKSYRNMAQIENQKEQGFALRNKKCTDVGEESLQRRNGQERFEESQGCVVRIAEKGKCYKNDGMMSCFVC